MKSNCISSLFDSVIMLTSSDWYTEPRSNRYHFAVRFSKLFPVVFVQNSVTPAINVQKSNFEGIDIVTTGKIFDKNDLDWMIKYLRHRGIKKPLLWIYNTEDYFILIQSLHRSFCVYHATENYFFDSTNVDFRKSLLLPSVKKSMPYFNLLIGVSSHVSKSFIKIGGYTGPVMTSENACDAEFFMESAVIGEIKGEEPKNRVAIYQGGINKRLDFSLLDFLSEKLNDWEFWFCGREEKNLRIWEELKKKSNVNYLGECTSEQLRELMHKSTVGIIPFHIDEIFKQSFPLKAFEYVACGLPVVSVPIYSLESYPELFQFASTNHDFADEIKHARSRRENEKLLLERKKISSQNSYNNRFENVCERLKSEYDSNLKSLKHVSYNILIFYDEKSTHVSAIKEHLESFKIHSRNTIFYFPATRRNRSTKNLDLNLFDAIIVHFSVRLSLSNHLNKSIAEKISFFHGLKVLFIQDEYDSTEIARRWIEKLKFDLVYTCVPNKWVNYVYPKNRFPFCEFKNTLTGYFSEDDNEELYSLPLENRKVTIGYRGRILPYHYGKLGREKYEIGIKVKDLAQQHDVSTDIEVDDKLRIYGEEWFKFLGNSKSMLGTESGSNVFDFCGNIKKSVSSVLENNPSTTFEEVYDKSIRKFEGPVEMNQISPKIFEAIKMKTALVLFEGKYSDIIQPDIHYISLRKDYSNFNNVINKLKDNEFLNKMINRAYEDIYLSNKFSYKSFINNIDSDLSKIFIRKPRNSICLSPSLSKNNFSGEYNVLNKSTDFASCTSFNKDVLDSNTKNSLNLPSSLNSIIAIARYSLSFQLFNPMWRYLRISLCIVLKFLISFPQSSILYRIFKYTWSISPRFLTDKIKKIIQSEQ